MNPISSLRILPADVDATTLPAPGDAETGFRDVLHSAIEDIEQLQSQAETKVAGVLSGNGTDVHSAMIAVEKADLSFQLMMQVRNKIVSAYEEISRMQF
ncbi:MAG TPA: flagellar hook-basal body complex protein FliE [Verrucomicrobiae bacterium]|jgi:flagellar hook-basal body complex protein FliE|nr:flagellar hook-basal body complex protein FliE [Verrucomicrobiae bacterium]